MVMVVREGATPDDDWLTRTGAATNALLQESKGQSWLASRASSTSLALAGAGALESSDGEEDEDDDEGYEEKALKASAARQNRAEEELSPLSPQISRWGSRYGSRAASRRASRRGSVTDDMRAGGLFRTASVVSAGQEVFPDEDLAALPSQSDVEPDFVDLDESDRPAGSQEEEATIARLTETQSFGLGGLVDRLMGFNLFGVEEREEGGTTMEAESETDGEASERRAKENKRRREEKERLTESNPPAPVTQEDGSTGVWQDAAWLLSVASKAMF